MARIMGSSKTRPRSAHITPQAAGAALPTGRTRRLPSNPLSHHSGNAAWLTQRPGDVVLEITDRRRTDIAGSHVGPGATALLRLARLPAALAASIVGQIKVPIVAAVAIDAEFDRLATGLDDAGAAHARDAACRCHPWHDPGFEPADGVGAFGGGIGEGPGATARVPLTARGALGGIAGSHWEAGIVPAGSVEADLSPGRRAGHEQQQKTDTQPEPNAPHAPASRSRHPASDPC
jgi:hypothetical protein